MLDDALFVGLVGSLDILSIGSTGSGSAVGLGIGFVKRGTALALPAVSRLVTTNPLALDSESEAGSGTCIIAENIVTVLTLTG